MMQAAPPAATAVRAPKRPARSPASKAPNGAMPMNIMEYTDITRPRSASGTMAWIRVFDDAVWTIMAKPTGIRSTVDSQKWRQYAKAIRPVPKAAVAQTIQRPSPRTSWRDARVSARSVHRRPRRP